MLFYGTFAVPFTAIGLAILGLPATHLLRHRARAWWVGVIAVLWGWGAGKLMWFGLDHLIFLGQYDPLQSDLLDMGAILGLATGLAWWLLRRREIIRGEAEGCVTV